MSTTCNPCDDFTCTHPVYECVQSLLLGRISNTNTQVYIHVVKQNGAEYIQAATSDASGFVTLDMTAPDRYFYNHFDGLYLIYIMLGGYFADSDKRTITAPGGTATTLGVEFKKCDGVNYVTQHIQLYQ